MQATKISPQCKNRAALIGELAIVLDAVTAAHNTFQEAGKSDIVRRVCSALDTVWSELAGAENELRGN